jgi:outer membrane protein TolC
MSSRSPRRGPSSAVKAVLGTVASLRRRIPLFGIAVALVTARAWGATPPAPADRPLGLADAVQLALARNERAKIADGEVVEARAAVEKARVAFLPTITATGTDTVRPYQVSRAGVVVTPYNVAGGTANITQPLVNLPAWPLYRQAQRLLDAQKASSTDARRILAFNAAQSFFNALASEAVLAAAERRFDTAKSSLDDAQARVQAQLNSSNDVTRAQLDLASAQQEVAADDGNVRNAYTALAFVINAKVAPPLVPPEDTLRVAANPVGPVDPLIASAVGRRPDLVAAKFTAKAAHDFAAEPLLRIAPTLTVAAGVTGSTLVMGSGYFTDETLVGTLAWQIYDGSNRYADKHSRDAAARIADLTQDTLVRQIGVDVATAVTQLESAQSQFKAAADAVTAARKNVGETATLYRQGLATALELTDANDSRFEAEIGYSGAEYAMALAYLALRQALGLDPIGTELK